jgi:sugar/nucleoside kinase (ribokinase family)
MKVIKRVDLMIINDEELRQLAGDWNVPRAANWLLAQGARRVIVKRGEHGALLVEPGGRFFAPAFPLEEVFDPTGAGDCFAGGVLGYIARSGEATSAVMRRAMVYGAAMGSFAVAKFGIGGFEGVTRESLVARVQSFKDLTHVDLAEPIG